jgi:ABC-type branched-subunit amino acid transport system substrate-binding protein
MKRWGVGAIGLIVISAVLVWSARTMLARTVPIRVGLLHSKMGSMASSEQSLIDAEMLVIAEINADGGLLNRPVEKVIADGKSDWKLFAQEATRLIESERVGVIRKFKAKYGSDQVFIAAIAMAYNSMQLWAEAVAEGDTDDVNTVRRLIAHERLSAPEGIISTEDRP